MSEQINEEVSEMPDELTSLKARADLMGITYHPSISAAKLREKVNASVADTAPKEVSAEESENAARYRLRQEALELIRVRVACMNPNKKEWEGEMFTVGNSLIGTQKKFVPFNNDEGWHIPRIIYNMMLERECQIFVSVKDSRGNTTRKGKLIKEFAIEVLPPLTAEELEELARRQAMAKSID